jgi:predicted nuclease of restriction endonuclease-like RecB superfamily
MGGVYELTISGPYSLFDAVTKYGLKLALCWPVLAAQSDLRLEAELRWGKKNEKLRFSLSSKALPEAQRERGTNDEGAFVEPVSSTEEVEQLRLGLEESIPGVSVKPSEQMLDLPGVGIIVPDLTCRFENGTEVFVEVLGFWSRAAVWRRIELVEAGLVAPILFVVSSRLRVSEEVLDDASTSALYVYRGRIIASSAAAKINVLADRLGTPTRKRAGRRST